MANLTSKELTALVDQITSEQTLIKKYEALSNMCTDSKIQSDLTAISNKHRSHYNTLISFLQQGDKLMPNAGNNTTLTEQEILQDCLSSQKFATSNYNTFAGECVNEQLRSAFLNILDDEHRIQADIFTSMNANGWYPVQPAEQQKVQQAKQQFSTMS